MEHEFKTLTLSGDTLGQRQRHYNNLVKQHLENPYKGVPSISHDEKDIDNFMKIDIASHNRDVDYILALFKCKDILYVTRAIKQCKWLVTDNRYSEIISPKYLHKELFPYMMAKAKSKLILHIRLHLKDKTRVKSFYKYFKEFDLNSALKWLPRCPLEYSFNEVRKHPYAVPVSLLKRLCRQSYFFLHIIANEINDYRKQYHMEASLFLIRQNAEEYLDIADSMYSSEVPHLKIRFLKIIMKVCPHRIFDNFSHYIDKIDYPTFLKYMKNESIKPFLLHCFQECELRKKISHDVLCHFLNRIPFEDRLEILKACFNSNTKNIDCSVPDGLNLLFSAIEDNAPFNSSNVFRWYQCMPFEISFRELTKTIQTELKSDVRHSMIKIILTSAGFNRDDIFTLLKYYHEKHINESFNFKVDFINVFLNVVKTYKFDTEMWKILDDLFCSMEIYMNSNLNVKKCVEAIIVYKTIHDEYVPETVESKFQFKTLKSYKSKLNDVKSEKLFSFLLKNRVKKLENGIITVCNETEFKEVINYLQNAIKLLADWNKHILSYQFIFINIKKCIEIKLSHRWNTDLSSIYQLLKSWKMHFIDDSLRLDASENVFLNALKHNRYLLNIYKHEVDSVRYDDTKILGKLLSKLKIYWPDCIAKEWADDYLNRLNKIGQQKVVIKSLAILLSQKQFLNIAEQHIPEEKIINWSETNELEYNLRKYFAMNIHRVRPLPTPEKVLMFAKGDYLKFAVPSLSATLANVSNADKEEYIPKLINVPVSLQKHGIRMAFSKFEVEKLITIFETIWKSTTNSTIRTILFMSTHQILCKEERQSRIIKLWKFISVFIDNLSNNENERIYKKLTRIEEVPKIIQGEYCMKAYLYFKALPNKLARSYMLNMVAHHSEKMLEILDEKFIEDEIIEPLQGFPSKSHVFVNIFAMFLLSAKDKETELDRYERLYKPLLDNAENNSSKNFCELNSFLVSQLNYYVISRKGIIPMSIYRNLLNHYRKTWSLPKDYVNLRSLELQYILIEILDRASQVTEGCENNDTFVNVAPDFGAACLKHLKKDLKTYFSSIYVLFENVLKDVFTSLGLGPAIQLHIYKHMLKDHNTIESYYLVQRMLPSFVFSSDKHLKAEIVEILCSHPSEEFHMICLYHYPDQAQVRQVTKGWRDTCIIM